MERDLFHQCIKGLVCVKTVSGTQHWIVDWCILEGHPLIGCSMSSYFNRPTKNSSAEIVGLLTLQQVTVGGK